MYVEKEIFDTLLDIRICRRQSNDVSLQEIIDAVASQHELQYGKIHERKAIDGAREAPYAN